MRGMKSWLVFVATASVMATGISVSRAQDEEEPVADAWCVQECYEEEDACYESCQAGQDVESCEAACASALDDCLGSCDEAVGAELLRERCRS